jgi:hypothetical protein
MLSDSRGSMVARSEFRRRFRCRSALLGLTAMSCKRVGIENLAPAENFKTLHGRGQLRARQRGWSASSRANLRGRIDPLSRMNVLSHFDGAGRCIWFYFSFGVRPSWDDAYARILRDNSRFGEFGSRLGPREFPVRIATGIRSQALDLVSH